MCPGFESEPLSRQKHADIAELLAAADAYFRLCEVAFADPEWYRKTAVMIDARAHARENLAVALGYAPGAVAASYGLPYAPPPDLELARRELRELAAQNDGLRLIIARLTTGKGL